MVNKNILKIRAKLDKLDNTFLDLIKKKDQNWLMKSLKKKFKKDIIDNKRIKVILRNINKKSKLKKIDPIITKKIWQSMIRAFIDYEYRNFKK